MIKKTTICVLSILFCVACWAQGGKPNIPLQKSSPDTPSKPLLDVLFATNEDCDLYVNGEAKGPVSKENFRYVKLAPGNYRYSAKSKATGDELTDSFSVSEEGTNEVFMDILFVVDEKAAERTRIQNASFSANESAKGNSTRAKDRARRTALTTEESQKETVKLLLNNVLFMNGGTFIMGNNRAPARDESAHTVILKPFYFSRFEVTQRQWESLMGYNPSFNKGCETCPVENVSWNEAMEFIGKLDSLSNRKFRLPTEAEWEYVARSGGRAEIEKAGGQEAYIKKTAWYFSNANGKAHPVGQKDSSAAGVFDLFGNVSEWCSDWYSPSSYKGEHSHDNPKGPATGKEKVVRGGNFKDYVGDRFRPSFRSKKVPTGKSNELGFRVVLDIAE